MEIDQVENEEVSNDVNDDANENLENNKEEVQETPAEEYTPDYGYSVRDEKFEFDEWIRPAVTSKEQEDAIRDMYTKARGLEGVQQNFEKTNTRLKEIEEQSTRYKEESEYATQGLEGLKKLAKDDFSSFAHIVGINDDSIMKYATQRLDYKDKPEYERQELDRERSNRAQSYERNIEMDNLRRQNEKLVFDRHKAKMEEAYRPPEIASFRAEFDKRMGEGAFEQNVKNYGSQQYQINKQYVEPMVAVQTIYSQFKPLFTDRLEEINKTETITKPPTNLGAGKAGTVVKRKVKSLKDLHKIANEIARGG